MFAVCQLSDRTDKFLVRLAEDLETYAAHAKRKTIEVEDALLLLKRFVYVVCFSTTFYHMCMNNIWDNCNDQFAIY